MSGVNVPVTFEGMAVKILWLLQFCLFTTSVQTQCTQTVLNRELCGLSSKLYMKLYSSLNCADPGDQIVFKLVESQNCQLSRHTVTTKDGYILNLHRVNCSSLCKGPSKGPVLLIHGLLGSSVQWVWNNAKQSLAYILAAECYDVWLMNVRGSAYSLNHLNPNLNCRTPSYWNFSFHESALNDLPKTIDLVLQVTGQSKLMTIGHSMGGTLIITTLSMKPEYNSKVSFAVLLAPSMNLNNSHFIPVSTGDVGGQIMRCISGPLLSRNNILNEMAGLCSALHADILCQITTDLILGTEDCRYYNKSKASFYQKYGLQSDSLKCLEHHRQIKQRRQFVMYDFGQKGNQEVYKQKCPPKYPVEKVTVPMFLFSGENDILVNHEDVKALSSELPVKCYRNLPKASHFVYFYSKNATAVGFPLLTCMMEKVRLKLTNEQDCWGCQWMPDNHSDCVN